MKYLLTNLPLVQNFHFKPSANAKPYCEQMTGPLCVEYPGAFYYVINRGNNQENTLKSDRDKEKFPEYLKLLSRYIRLNQFYILAG